MSFCLPRNKPVNTQAVTEYMVMSPRELEPINAHFIPDDLFPSDWEDDWDEKYYVPDPRAYVYSLPPPQPHPQPQPQRCTTPYIVDYRDDVSKSTQFSYVTPERSRSPVDSLDDKQLSVDFAEDNQEVDFRPKTLTDVRQSHEICAWALKRHTSMKLQEFVRAANHEEKQEAWLQIAENAVKLSKNQYGNCFMQEFLVQASPNLRMEMASHLTSHVKEMSHDSFGCWVIQKAIEVIPNIGDYWMGPRVFSNGVSSSLTDQDLSELIVCKHGHYVIQKLLEKNISADVLERIEKVLYGNVYDLCVDSSGYHVVLDILKCATSSRFNAHLLEEVSKHCLALSKHQYGNYVVKKAIQNNDNISHTIGVVVLRNLEVLSLNKFATHVVEAYLDKCSTMELSEFISKLLNRSDKKLVRFLRHQTGNYVVQRLIRNAARRDVKKIRQRLERRGLKKSVQTGNGCHVVEELEKKLKLGK